MFCQRKYETDLCDRRPNKLKHFISPSCTIAQSNTLAIIALWHVNINTHYNNHNNTAWVCVHRWGWDVGGEKDKDKKKEVREREMAHIWNEWKRGGGKKPTTLPQKARFSLALLKKHTSFLDYGIDKTVFPKSQNPNSSPTVTQN